MMRQAASVSILETVMTIIFSVSKMNATETAARKTPKYRLALLRKNWANSMRMSLEYLTNKIRIDAKARNIIIIV
jgi:hypothetical protein